MRIRSWSENLLNMFGWGIMAAVLANLSVQIPGLEGGVSDMREIAAVAGVAFVTNWWYALGIGVLAACGGPYDNSLPFTFFMHVISIPIIYFIYHNLLSRVRSSLIHPFASFASVLIIYAALFSSTFVLASFIFNSVPLSDTAGTYKAFFSGTMIEGLLTAVIVTLIFTIKNNSDQSWCTFNYLQLALENNIIRTMWRLDPKDQLTFFTHHTTIISVFGKNSCSIEDFYEKFTQYSSSEANEQLKTHLKELRSGGREKFELVYPIEVPGEAKRWILIKGVVDTQKRGNTKDIFGFSIDITDYHRTLEENKILQNQLIQTQKMQSIGQLAGGVAHDFNNLLTIINGYAEILKEDLQDNEELTEHIDGIADAGEKATKLTAQLLAFSRKQIYDPKPVNINSIISDLENMLKRLINEDIEININLNNKIKLIEADANQIEQVLINLVLNARDAVNDAENINHKLITIKTDNITFDEEYAEQHPDVSPGRYVIISVSDNGIGMSKETMEHVFEPFFTTKGKGVGTGLGMSTVYGIVQQNGGSISIESEEKKGTTVTLNWIVSEKFCSHSTTDKTKIALSGKESLLLVEDNEELKKFATLSLQKLGYQVRNASNGLEALQILEDDYRPLLVLTDIIMPRMDGYELAKELKKKYPDLKILFMSGYTDRQIVKNGQLNDDVHFIQKPYTIKQLSKIIREIIEEKLE